MAGLKSVKIFLASSSELKDDREQFEIFINRKNKQYIKQAIFLELIIWEDFLDAMSATRLQDEYNKAISGCDVFVSLFKTKVGQYTEEEFTKALETFRVNQKPLIYTYFKDSEISLSTITSEILSLINFKNKLSQLGHFYTVYKNIEDLKYRFDEQLNKFIPDLKDSLSEIFYFEQSQLNEIENLNKKLIAQEQSHKNQLQQIEATYHDKQKALEQLKQTEIEEIRQSYQNEKQQLEQSVQAEINQLQQELEIERSQGLNLANSLEIAQSQLSKKESIIAELKQQIKALIPLPPPEQVELKSEKGVDYTKLCDLLAAGQWKKADQETGRVMLEAANQTSRGWLEVQDIDNCPCEDLRTINQLWLHYSKGKFGFSVQAEIYRSLGGTREYNQEVWEKFGDRVGWRKEGSWLNYDDLDFNINARIAHLPGNWEVLWFGSVVGVWWFGFYSLVSRLVSCNISPSQTFVNR